jgi:hypothetical protein
VAVGVDPDPAADDGRECERNQELRVAHVHNAVP